MYLRKLLTITLLFVVTTSTTSYAAGKLRIGTMVPKNSFYHQQLLEVCEAWRTNEGGGKYLIYPDGRQGGETDMVRRMRIGQLQGGLLSVNGLETIEPSIAALQNMPLMFRNWGEVDHVREKMRAGMEQKFYDKGFVVLAWGDAGWVRFFTKDQAVSPGDFKGMKFFAWGSDAAQQEIMKNLGYTPVPLEVSDILPSIQTGMIEAVPSTPYFALASQIYTTANHMLDLNWAPIVGALVVTRKAWDEMSPATQAAVREAGEIAGDKMRVQARKEVGEAVEAMQKRGLTVSKPNAEQMKLWRKLADELYPQIRGKLVPAETFDEVLGYLADYRAAGSN
jgi:TRAP-type C4-dicarboxylate transport system substrate-binding protein